LLFSVKFSARADTLSHEGNDTSADAGSDGVYPLNYTSIMSVGRIRYRSQTNSELSGVRTMILQDLSPAGVALALDANKIASGMLLSTLPNATLHNESGILWFETGLALDAYNGVLQTSLSREALPEAISRVLTHFQARNLPFHWRPGPSSQPENIGDLLEAHGILNDEDEPGMAVDLLAINEDLPAVPSLRIEEALSASQIRQWSETTFVGAPPETIDCVFTVHSYLPLGPENSVRLYLGTLAGKPVATVKLFFAAGVAYIGRVVTIPEFRRRGIGAAMTLHALHTAHHAGYRVAVLTASPMGIAIYRRLGFREYCLVRSYAWNPVAA
jgi:GNAT superfamily N-acetyltransferase